MFSEQVLNIDWCGCVTFPELLLVHCFVQVCYGTVVEHISLLNQSGVCDGMN
jgi:hypothetical protein